MAEELWPGERDFYQVLDLGYLLVEPSHRSVRIFLEPGLDGHPRILCGIGRKSKAHEVSVVMYHADTWNTPHMIGNAVLRRRGLLSLVI